MHRGWCAIYLLAWGSEVGGCAQAFAALTDVLKADRYLHPHCRYYTREVRKAAYVQVGRRVPCLRAVHALRFALAGRVPRCRAPAIPNKDPQPGHDSVWRLHSCAHPAPCAAGIGSPALAGLGPQPVLVPSTLNWLHDLRAQFLDAYKSVTLDSMAASFGVSPAFIDAELEEFIVAGHLTAKIDKVAGVVETNRCARVCSSECAQRGLCGTTQHNAWAPLHS